MDERQPLAAPPRGSSKQARHRRRPDRAGRRVVLATNRPQDPSAPAHAASGGPSSGRLVLRTAAPAPSPLAAAATVPEGASAPVPAIAPVAPVRPCSPPPSSRDLARALREADVARAEHRACLADELRVVHAPKVAAPAASPSSSEDSDSSSSGSDAPASKQWSSTLRHTSPACPPKWTRASSSRRWSRSAAPAAPLAGMGSRALDQGDAAEPS